MPPYQLRHDPLLNFHPLLHLLLTQSNLLPLVSGHNRNHNLPRRQHISNDSLVIVGVERAQGFGDEQGRVGFELEGDDEGAVGPGVDQGRNDFGDLVELQEEGAGGGLNFVFRLQQRTCA